MGSKRLHVVIFGGSFVLLSCSMSGASAASKEGSSCLGDLQKHTRKIAEQNVMSVRPVTTLSATTASFDVCGWPSSLRIVCLL